GGTGSRSARRLDWRGDRTSEWWNGRPAHPRALARIGCEIFQRYRLARVKVVFCSYPPPPMLAPIPIFLRVIPFLLLAALCLTPWASPPIALAAGVLLA